MELLEKLRKYHDQYGLEYYDDVLGDETDFDVWKQLSILRAGLFLWYPFKRNSTILEIGAEYGALTGILCERCAKVVAFEADKDKSEFIRDRWIQKNNLTVLNSVPEELPTEEKYDYIILTEGLKKHIEDKSYLISLSRLLNDGGRILLTENNRFGLRYLCGAVDELSGEAFGEISGFTDECKSGRFSKAKITKIVEESKPENIRFYYPLPNYLFPQLIFSDEYLPGVNLKERLRPYYRRNDTLIADELSLYDDIVQNGVFQFAANSFLIELTYGVYDRKSSNAIFAAVTADRRKDRAYSTVIFDDDSVKKIPVYAGESEGSRRQLQNVSELKEKKVPVLDIKMDDSGTVLERFVRLPLLSEYMKSCIFTDPEIAFGFFDKISDYVMLSSEQTGSENNALLNKYDCSGIDFGPILKKAYIEMIPMNCFFDPETREYLFFDQEFVKDNYPAGYVMYRCVRYFYEHNPGIERLYPKEKMIRRYHLEAAWDIYEKEELSLQQENCQLERYRSFYGFNAIDRNRIKENHYKLESEVNQINREDFGKTVRRMHEVQIDLLEEFDRICKKHGITYYLFWGTLLGAVRHHGIIPWDDDVDVALFREDYERFIKVASVELKEPYALTNNENNPYGNIAPLLHLVNTNTTHIESCDIGKEGIHGIHIDIQPLDVYPPDDKDKIRLQKKMDRINEYLWSYVYGSDFISNDRITNLKVLIKKYFVKCIGYVRMCRKLERTMQMFSDSDSGYIGCWLDYHGKIRKLNRADFEKSVQLEFEGKEYPVPIGYKNVLFQLYGSDYMKLPPKEDRKYHRDGIRNPDVPYMFYHSILNGMFEDIQGKQIIIFGAGLMLEDYMAKYGSRYRPSFIVDNDSGKWNHEVFGIDIKEPEEICRIPEKKRHVIICSFYYREIMKQLDEMGIHDFKVYVQHPEWIADSERKEYDS